MLSGTWAGYAAVSTKINLTSLNKLFLCKYLLIFAGRERAAKAAGCSQIFNDVSNISSVSYLSFTVSNVSQNYVWKMLFIKQFLMFKLQIHNALFIYLQPFSLFHLSELMACKQSSRTLNSEFSR